MYNCCSSITSETQLGQCADLPTQNQIIAPIFALMELSALYQDILGKGGCHALSPQVWKLDLENPMNFAIST